MNIGDKIPEIFGTDDAGRTVTASDFKGKPLIIYFYPKDNTPGCTAEACSIRDGYEQLTASGYSHLRFREKFNLNFILLSDTSTEVNQAFGVWQKKKMAGREYMGTVRTTFITDADHTVTHIIKKVDTKNAATQLLDIING